jgi:dihydropteroate synthase
MNTLRCGRFRLSLSRDDRPLIMGIVNLTPDSFSGDGTGDDATAAIARAEMQRDAGADLLDLGAESTRPGAAPVPAETELARLLPVLRAVRDWGLPISVDTNKPAVMRAALDAGADLINDIAALSAPGALDALAALAASEAAVCLMHMQGEPRTMQTDPHYVDVVGEVADFLAGRVAACERAGIARDRLLVDPGFGFGKTVEHNYALLRGLERLERVGVPVLAGLSRKSMLGAVTGRENGAARLPASVVAAVLAVQRGARVLRVHDVAATRDALAVWAATEGR